MGILFLFSLFSLAAQTKLAVLPFDNTSGSPDYEWLSLGIPETLSLKLAEVHNLRLVERLHLDALIEEYKLALTGLVNEEDAVEPGELAGADLLLLGGFQIQGDSILITIRLLDAATGTVPAGGGGSVQGDLDSIFLLYDSLARQIVQTLGVSLTPAEEKRLEDPRILTSSMAAYEWYIRGKAEFREGTETGYIKALEYFQKAESEDSRFGLVHAFLALTLEEISYLRAVSGRAYADYSNQVPGYYEKAVEYGQEGAEIYKALARLLYLRGDYIQGLRQIEKSIYINPMDGESWLIWWQIKDGRDPDHPYLKKALEIAPDSADVQMAMGEALLGKSRTAEALYHLTRAYDLDPGNLKVLYGLAELYEHRGDYEEALASYKAIYDKAPGETAAVIQLVTLYYQSGQLEECISLSRSFLEKEPGTMPVRFSLFLSYCASGRFDLAEKELDTIMTLDPKSGFFYDPIRELGSLTDDPEIGEKANAMKQKLYEIKERLGKKERESR